MKPLSSTAISAVPESLRKGESLRKIESRLGVSKSTIQRLSSRLADCALSFDEALQMKTDELLELLYLRPNQQFNEPDRFEVHTAMQKHKATLFAQYERYRAACSDWSTVFSYKTFCRRYAAWKRANGHITVAGNTEHRPGERIEVDFSGDALEWVDSYSHVRKARLFVACLPYSNMLFVEAFADEKQNSRLDGIVDALHYFGGAPEVLVMDNAKPLIKHVDWSYGEPQPWVQALREHFSMEPWSCKPATPKQKNRVEAAVGNVERWIIAHFSVTGRPIAVDLNDLNAQILQRVNEINEQPFRAAGLKGSRRSRFLEEEQQHLKPLSTAPFERGDWKVLVVDKAHCFRIYCNNDQHRYSVPSQYIGKKVCRNHLVVYDMETQKEICRHERYFNAVGIKTHILPEHLTAAERHYRLSKNDWIRQLRSRGIPLDLVTRFVEEVWSRNDFSGGRVCGAVNKLTRKYPARILSAAIERSLEIKEPRYKRIKALCEQFDSADRTNGSLDLQGGSYDLSYVTVRHSNIRNDYE